MYAVKGSWVGQTFAVSAASDSGGRKSRIRRSKEERKAMVETFIQRYQSVNNGDFPSLNLTHKEVGGSFYTVREIVREIIQENRVLGPARFSPEVLHDDTVAAHYPLGSIATAPYGCSFEMVDEFNAVSHNQGRESLELISDNNEHYTNHHNLGSCQSSIYLQLGEVGSDTYNKSTSENSLPSNEDLEMSLNGSGQWLNGGCTDCIQTNGMSQESDMFLAEGLPVSKSMEVDEVVEVVGECKSKLTLLAEEVTVETFSLRPAAIEDLGSGSTHSAKLNGTLSSLKIQAGESSNGSSDMDNISSLFSSTEQIFPEWTNGESSMSGGSQGLVSGHVGVNGMVIHHDEFHLKEVAPEKPASVPNRENTSMHPNAMDQTMSHSSLTQKAAEHDNYQSNNAPKATSYSGNSNGITSQNSNNGPPPLVSSVNDNRRDNKAVAGSSRPLDRINLQSWEKAVSKQQPNPLLAFFRAFVGAFVKFWS